MTAIDDQMVTLHLTSAQWSERDRVEAFREIFGRAVLCIDIEPVEDSALEAEMTLRGFSGLGMASGRLSPMRNRHLAEASDNNDLVLVMLQSGFATLEQGGRRIEVKAGQVVMTANGEPATFTGHTATRVVNLRLSRDVLAPYMADADRILARPLLRDGPALRFLKSYASCLNDERALATPQLRHSVATHMHELAALAIGAEEDAEQLAVRGGVRAARLSAIKADIVANSSDPGLNTAAVAARHGITERYVRRLFGDEHTSFSEFVLGIRLARAQRLLADAAHPERTISAIAFACGFGDLSYFNRTFRRQFGLTPSDMRAAAAAGRQN